MGVDKDYIQSLNKTDFLKIFSSVYEHSAWVAEQLWPQCQQLTNSDVPLAEAFQQAMAAIVDASHDEQKLSLLRAHPDLAGKAALAGELTAASTNEQASAGLDSCTEQELAAFHTLNGRYKSQFGFPFIMAVKGANKHMILNGFNTRLDNSYAEEFNTALREVHKIARFRLQDIFAA
ncbi:2-oxo-4-hydroxy-4-carboxy-5-ureidoimidazoline decarboxylase [Shewanella sp.]|uniref:2-oxo-4-hydroxy-4-carboxy-5-ureidoimidazoline decarboxylase n=1 Tax=Shewanella sp. TaxID=50422 RepID=UPI003A97E090